MALNERNKEIIERIEAGETQFSLAKEFGISRQAINFLWNRYKKEGDEVFVLKTKGAKKAQPLTKSQIEFCKDAFQNKVPADFDLADPGEGWGVEQMQALVKETYGFHVRVNRMRAHMVRWGWEPPTLLDEEKFDPEFIAYLNSPQAKELARKEAEYIERSEAERAKRPKRGRGRPRKIPLPEVPDEDDEDSYALPDVEEMKRANAETLKKVKMARCPAPGVRTGKHAKAKSNVTKPKRRKKGKKRR